MLCIKINHNYGQSGTYVSPLPYGKNFPFFRENVGDTFKRNHNYFIPLTIFNVDTMI